MELTAKEIMGLKMAVQQQQRQGNWVRVEGGGGGAAEARRANIITRVDEI